MDILDVLTVLSFCVGLMNLDLNEEQVANLDKHLKEQDEHLAKQDEILLDKILDRLDVLQRSLEELRL